MIQSRASRTAHCLVPLAAALSGCTALEGFMHFPEATREEAEPLAARTRLEPIDANLFVLETAEQTVVGDPQIVFTREEDTFSDLAREYGLGFDELTDANPGIDPWLPGEGTPVLLPTQFVLPDAPKRGLVLNIASKRLFYYPAVGDGEPVTVMTFPIGIGRVGWETPLGEAAVVSKARDPHWFVPPSVRQEQAEAGYPLPAVVPPGPDNPLGKFVLKLDMPGYLIHGTNQPYGVGMRVSHGCVRLYPENIELLYSLVDLGETVRIVNQPFLAGWRDGDLYFEGHRPLEDDTVAADQHLARVLMEVESGVDAAGLDGVLAQLRSIAADGSGIPVRVLRNDVAEVYERARVVNNTVEPDPDALTLAEARAILDAPLDVPLEELVDEVATEDDAEDESEAEVASGE